MNYAGNYETGMYEAGETYGEAYEGENWEQETLGESGMAPHPVFGMVRPHSGEYENFEQYEEEHQEATPAGFVPHPVFGMVRPRRASASEVLEYEEEIIGTGDERFRVTNTKAAPYRWVCFLEMTFPGFDAIGSGLLISPRHVLTCGHNLIDPDSRTSVQSIKVVPGCNGRANRPFGFQTSRTWRTSDEWRTSFNRLFDYGLITLSNPIGNIPQRVIGNKTFDYWGKPGTHTLLLPIQPGSSGFRGTKATVSGYPGDKPLAAFGGEQWAANGIITNMAPAVGRELIHYTADTCAGHSGSPVWIRRGDNLCLFAIHTGSCTAATDCRQWGSSRCANTPRRKNASANRAVLWSPTVAAKVRSWMGP